MKAIFDEAGNNVVYVRWRTRVPGSGYDVWNGDAWVPITMAEYRSYIPNGFAVHMNPRWSHRG